VSFGGFGGLGGANIGSALIRIGADMTGVRNEVRTGMAQMRAEMAAGMRGMGAVPVGGLPITRELDNVARKANAAATAMKLVVLGGGIAAASGIGAAVKAAIDFESSFAGVEKTVQATGEELEMLKTQFRGLAQEIPVSVNELNKIGEAAGALGVPTGQILEFVRVVATIGTTTNVSTEEAAKALGSLSNVLQLRSEDYSRFAATLVDLGNKGASTESEILEMASRAGGAGKLIGLGADEILGFASSVANLQVGVEAGGSVLQKFFLLINQFAGSGSGLAEMAGQVGMTNEQLMALANDGGEEARVKFEEVANELDMTGETLKKLIDAGNEWTLTARKLGIDPDAFKALYDEDPAGAIQELLRAIGALESTERQQVLTALGIDDIRSTRVLLGWAQNVDMVSSSLNTASTAWGENTAATVEAEKRYKTTTSQLQLMQNALNDTLITLGQNFLPILVEVFNYLREAIPKVAEALGDIWNDVLVGPLGELWDALVRIGGVLADIVLDWGPGGPGESTTGVFESLAEIVGNLAGSLASVLDTLSDILSNPVVAGLAKLVVMLTAANLAFRGLRGIGQAVGGLVGGTLRAASFGLFDMATGGKGKPQDAIDASGRQQQAAATQQQKAAAQQATAAATQEVAARTMLTASRGMSLGDLSRAGLAGGAGARFPMGGPGMFAPPQYRGGGLPALAQTPMGQAAAARAAQAAGTGMVRDAASRLGAGLQQGVTAARGLIATGTSLVSRAFWPLFVADLIGNLAAAPLGDAIANSTGWGRLRESAKQGWVALVGDTLQAFAEGTDEWVGRQEAYNIGGASLSPEALRGLGVSPGTLDALEGATTEFEDTAAQLRGMNEELAALEAGAPDIDTLVRNYKEYAERYKIDLGEFPRTTTFGPGGNMGTMGPSGLGAGGLGINLWQDMLNPSGEDTALKEKWAESARALLRLEIADRFDTVNGAFIDAIQTAAEEVGLDLPGFRISRLTTDQAAELGGLLAEAGGDPRAGLVARFAAEEMLGGSIGKLTTAEERAGDGIAALNENLEANQEDWDGFSQWLQDHKDSPLFRPAEQLLGQFGLAAERAQTPEQRLDVMKRTGETFTSEELLSPEAMNARWEKFWAGMQYAMEVTGVDQRALLGDNFTGILVQALNDGVPWSELSAKYGPMIGAMLYDGVGESQTDVAQRLGNVFKQVMAVAIEQAGSDPALQAAAVRMSNEMFGTAFSPNAAGFKQLVSMYVSSLRDEVTAATQAGPEAEAAFYEQLNASLPQGVLTPEEVNALLSDKFPADAFVGLASNLGTQMATQITPVVEQGTTDIAGHFGMPLVEKVFTAIGLAAPSYQAAGTQIVTDIGVGVDAAAPTLFQKIASLFANTVLGQVPQSPVREGPLKHPTLPRAGAAMVRQIQEGINAARLSLPSASMPGLASPGGLGRPAMPSFASSPPPMMAAAMGGGPMGPAAISVRSSLTNQRATVQHISVDKMTVLGPQDRHSLVRQFEFMTGGARSGG
jgi:hypothetical protein